jgi:hypothetical protein
MAEHRADEDESLATGLFRSKHARERTVERDLFTFDEHFINAVVTEHGAVHDRVESEHSSLVALAASREPIEHP